MSVAQYRMTCDQAPHWNKTPGNRFSKGQAEKHLAAANRTCPGVHKIEEIKGE